MPKGIYQRESLEKRLMRRVCKRNECWQWIWISGPNGYGQITKNGKTCSAHRASYEVFKGPIPNGMHVLHSCHNSLCVNPEHLRLGTHQENMRDRQKCGRYSWVEARAKLTPDKASAIKHRYALGGVTHRQLAREYGISKTQVGHIVREEQWVSA